MAHYPLLAAMINDRDIYADFSPLMFKIICDKAEDEAVTIKVVQSLSRMMTNTYRNAVDEYIDPQYDQFFHLLRNNKIGVSYCHPYNAEWTRGQICRYMLSVDCSNCGLTILPDLPNCTNVTCWGNKLSKLPDLPSCIHINCANNILTEIPDLPRCKTLICWGNLITKLPPLAQAEIIDCAGNNITIIPEFPQCKSLNCLNNPLKYQPKLPNCTEKIYNISIPPSLQ